MAEKRVRSAKPPLIPIDDWQQVDAQMHRIGILQQQITEAEFAAKGKIDKVKAELAEEVNRRAELIKLHAASIEAFAVNHQADFGDKRSRELNFGICGWRKSTSISIHKTTLDLIKQVFTKAKAALYIHTKESVNKEALANLTDETLHAVKARRETMDVFFVEPVSTEAAKL